jgi:hypothetical protein
LLVEYHGTAHVLDCCVEMPCGIFQKVVHVGECFGCGIGLLGSKTEQIARMVLPTSQA